MSCPFIFIHTGSESSTLQTCIDQIHVWNEDPQIFLIADKAHIEIVKGCVFIDLETIPMSYKRSAIQNYPAINEHLFILEDFITMAGINECIYLENNTMVYFYLDDMLPILRRTYTGITAPYLGKGDMSFGILYIKDAHILTEMNSFLVRTYHLSQNKTKMCCRYFLENRHVADFLPTVSNECEIRADDEIFATSHGSIFRGIWDSGAHGQYLYSTVVNESSSFDTSQFTYEWLQRDGGLRHPRAHRHGHSWPLYTLKLTS